MAGPEGTIYPGGFAKLMTFLERRQRPFHDAASVLPAADIDLNTLRESATPAPDQNYNDIPRYNVRRKWLELQREFQGQPQILHLHAMLIAMSRRTDPPAHALPLFFRIWDEQGPWMADTLNTRWLISTATTFADCGRTPDQRALGMGLTTLFDLVKLHDSERRASGLQGDTPARFVRRAKRPDLGWDMAPYSFAKGDADKVMLARFWQLAERDSTIRPLAIRMLRLAITDPRSIFGRLQALKDTP